MGDETQEIRCDKIGETDKALQVEYMGSEAWLPKSQIERLTTDDGVRFAITIPTWLYEKSFEAEA